MPTGIMTTLAAGKPAIDTGHTAFMLISAALVMVMTPALPSSTEAWSGSRVC